MRARVPSSQSRKGTFPSDMPQRKIAATKKLKSHCASMNERFEVIANLLIFLYFSTQSALTPMLIYQQRWGKPEREYCSEYRNKSSKFTSLTLDLNRELKRVFDNQRSPGGSRIAQLEWQNRSAHESLQEKKLRVQLNSHV